MGARPSVATTIFEHMTEARRRHSKILMRYVAESGELVDGRLTARGWPVRELYLMRLGAASTHGIA
jgi:hypothetical protein